MTTKSILQQQVDLGTVIGVGDCIAESSGTNTTITTTVAVAVDAACCCCYVCDDTAVVRLTVQTHQPQQEQHQKRFKKAQTSENGEEQGDEDVLCYCLLHYYTTDACRGIVQFTNNTDTSVVTKVVSSITLLQLNSNEIVQSQSIFVQELFAEAYLQIQQEIQQQCQRQHIHHSAHHSMNTNVGQCSIDTTTFGSDNDEFDPLAIITDLNKGKEYKHNRPENKKGSKNIYNLLLQQQRKQKQRNKLYTKQQQDGGFLRNIPIPERIIHVQQEQIRKQDELIYRMNNNNNDDNNINHYQFSNTSSLTSPSIPKKGTANSKTGIASPYNVTQRRQSTRTNIWNSVISSSTAAAEETNAEHDIVDNDKAKEEYEVEKAQQQEQSIEADGVICSCGNSNNNNTTPTGSNKTIATTTGIEIISSNIYKNQIMTKAETWGNKDREDEVTIRYRCNKCGKQWYE